MRKLTEEEHLRYHLEVSLTNCGVEGCDWIDGLNLHFKALKEFGQDNPPNEEDVELTDLDDF
jgi:hypothetical protein